VVLANGDVLTAGRAGITLLRDRDGDGVADLTRVLTETSGTGIGYHDGYLWLSPNDRVLRWHWQPGDDQPLGSPEVMVRDLPTGGHAAKTFTFLGGDTLIVNIGSRTNSCQVSDRSTRSPGKDPCPELTERAGLWRFSSVRLDQRPAAGVRFATGLRNAMALAVHPGNHGLYALSHGRDQLGDNWGFSPQANAELPAEELFAVHVGDDFGWPYCYYDWQVGVKVLAPEYGGDGRSVGRCAGKTNPLLGFPGHWAPMAITFYTGAQFPDRYRGGAFVAFHGSWNRAPLPQAGYRVVFVPFDTDGRPDRAYDTFAVSAKGPTALRPAGLAVGPDGSLYLGDEEAGTVWRVMFRGS
jgi:glucose/arabinose dehydrogenase